MVIGAIVFVVAIGLLGSKTAVASGGTQCLSNSGKPVDWFIIYKIPEHVSLPVNSLFYMDTDQLSWQLQQKTIDQTGHAVYNTLQQIYSSSDCKEPACDSADLLYVMYNDQEKSGDHRWHSTSHGHTKGVLAFDKTSGFWLVHSTPDFPPARDTGYRWPDSGKDYGQTFLCISMGTSQNLDNIGKQLQYNYPLIYDKASSAYFDQKFPNMAAAMNKRHVTEAPWNNEMKMTSLAGTTFTSFAKFSKFEKDLYEDWLAPRFGDTLLVETWQNGSGGKLCTNCTGKYSVYNVASIGFSSASVVFKETKDHAKWAVTKTQHVTCIGDINRMESQERRAGGTVCFQNTAVWNNFRDIINSTHACGTC